MDENRMKSIIEMNMGAFIERINYEMPKIIANCLDPNTKVKAKRKMTVTFEFCPDENRQNIPVKFNCDVKLAPTTELSTLLYVCDAETVVEATPQIPGQFGMDGVEQKAPPMLKLIKTAM